MNTLGVYRAREQALQVDAQTSRECSLVDTVNGMQGNMEDAWANKRLLQVMVNKKSDLEAENKAMYAVIEEMSKAAGINVSDIERQISERTVEICKMQEIHKLEVELSKQFRAFDTCIFHCQSLIMDLRAITDYSDDRLIELVGYDAFNRYAKVGDDIM